MPAATVAGEPDAGNPHVRFDEGQSAVLRIALCSTLLSPEIARRRDREHRYEAACHYCNRDRSKDPEPDFGPVSDLKAA